MAEYGNVIDEVHYGYVGAVISARADVVSPASIGIGHCTQIAATTAAGCWIFRPGQCIEGT